jgi:1-acyl-sn-glycerol-3-phosphate acyltransferase
MKMEKKQKPGGLKDAFLRRLEKVVCAVIKTAFRNKIVKKNPIDYSRNYFILCAHGSGFDFFHTMAALKSLDYVAVAARKLFFGRFLGALLRARGAIPKKQYQVQNQNPRRGHRKASL